MLWTLLLCWFKLCTGDISQLWVQQDGTSVGDQLLGISADSGGNLYVTGRTLSSFDGFANKGGNDIVLIMYASDGSKVWSKQEGTNGEDGGQSGTDHK